MRGDSPISSSQDPPKLGDGGRAGHKTCKAAAGEREATTARAVPMEQAPVEAKSLTTHVDLQTVVLRRVQHEP